MFRFKRDTAFRRHRNKQAPLTKGQALEKARELLGPSATVLDAGEWRIIRTENKNVSPAFGKTWEEALELAAKSSEADAWMDAQVEEGNKIAEASESLLNARRKIMEANTRSFIQNLTERRQKKESDRKKSIENFELWKEGREEEYQLALSRTKGRAMKPFEDLVDQLDLDRWAAKDARIIAYSELGVSRD